MTHGIYEQIIYSLFECKISSIDQNRMQIRWNMVEPIPGSVMHFARIREIA